MLLGGRGKINSDHTVRDEMRDGLGGTYVHQDEVFHNDGMTSYVSILWRRGIHPERILLSLVIHLSSM